MPRYNLVVPNEPSFRKRRTAAVIENSTISQPKARFKEEKSSCRAYVSTLYIFFVHFIKSFDSFIEILESPRALGHSSHDFQRKSLPESFKGRVRQLHCEKKE